MGANVIFLERGRGTKYRPTLADGQKTIGFLPPLSPELIVEKAPKPFEKRLRGGYRHAPDYALDHGVDLSPRCVFSWHFCPCFVGGPGGFLPLGAATFFSPSVDRGARSGCTCWRERDCASRKQLGFGRPIHNHRSTRMISETETLQTVISDRQRGAAIFRALNRDLQQLRNDRPLPTRKFLVQLKPRSAGKVPPRLHYELRRAWQTRIFPGAVFFFQPAGLSLTWTKF